MEIRSSNKTLNLSSPQVMGILNTTPDSFSDGGQFTSPEKALAHADSMIEAGATIIDVGGESTRPGAAEVTVAEELERVVPVVGAIRQKYPDIWISVDTSKAEVMQQSIDAGADMINDIRSLQEPDALAVVAKANIPVCLMHMQGQPGTMQERPEYRDVVQDVYTFLNDRITICEEAGIRRENIILDPGFGFGKTLEHNYHLLANLNTFHQFGLPLLIGLSRKTMLHKFLGKQPADCMVASVVCAAVAAMQGAQIFRVHDVDETVEAMKIISMIQANQS
ncbi:Dihydropteroate synthase [Vibrio ruber DSM 16370]|uniref:Dihydropteroate synthase n=1 Tax=Vibrio ruber (strain DSM 16370 / JCM 11486 / BCRC 17186 / CECT 7878 / LMG 23124 / VR1) TaxID=1123498 RepID=A0A1R4LBR2_VIBR1|nr:dihydropteroate synthase [Vibrio ruber]SJN54010.1 Dihydropteroate synthase [Vibrio ruber DSM 16370]